MREKTRNKLNYLAETKSLMKSVLIEKGQEVANEDDFRSYVDKIRAISGGGSADKRIKYVTFMHGDIELIKYPVIVGDDCKDVVTANIIEAPTKEPTESTVYSFGGWSLTDGGEADPNALTNVTENRTVYFVFAESVRMYTVNFYDGDTLVNTEQVAYGGSSVYLYEKQGYNFDGWLPAPTNIKGDLDCYAQWSELPTFANSSWADIMSVVDSGKAAETFAVGDKRTITMSDGTTNYLYILGFNHDTLADGTGKASMTMALYNPTADTMPVEDWSTVSSTMKTAIKPQLPTEIQSSIKSVLKPCDNRDRTAIVDIAFELFPLSVTECKITTLISYSTDEFDGKFAILGTPYAYFENAYKSSYGGPYYDPLYDKWAYTTAMANRPWLRSIDHKGLNRVGITSRYFSGSKFRYYTGSDRETNSRPVTCAFCV